MTEGETTRCQCWLPDKQANSPCLSPACAAVPWCISRTHRLLQPGRPFHAPVMHVKAATSGFRQHEKFAWRLWYDTAGSQQQAHTGQRAWDLWSGMQLHLSTPAQPPTSR